MMNKNAVAVSRQLLERIASSADAMATLGGDDYAELNTLLKAPQFGSPSVQTIALKRGLRRGRFNAPRRFDTESVKLLPCPFCGGPAVKIMWLPEGVENGECCCPDPECPGSGVECPYENWNARCEPEPTNSGGAGKVVLPERDWIYLKQPIRMDGTEFIQVWQACLDLVEEMNND